MIIFKTLDQIHSYLGYKPIVNHLTVCHENGVFNKGFGGKFLFFTLYSGKCTKVFYQEGFHFQISCYMYKAVEPVDERIVKLVTKNIKHDQSGVESVEIFFARPFTSVII